MRNRRSRLYPARQVHRERSRASLARARVAYRVKYGSPPSSALPLHSICVSRILEIVPGYRNTSCMGVKKSRASKTKSTGSVNESGDSRYSTNPSTNLHRTSDGSYHWKKIPFLTSIIFGCNRQDDTCIHRVYVI